MESVISLSALASALGIGLLIGAVRERAQADDGQSMAGVRTHLLVALAGTLGVALGTAVLVTVLVLIGALAVAGYVRAGARQGQGYVGRGVHDAHQPDCLLKRIRFPVMDNEAALLPDVGNLSGAPLRSFSRFI
jgi:hypothetical protein